MTNKLKPRLWIVPVLMTAVAFGQGGRFAGGGASANSGTPTFTPPTAEQLATGQATMIARFLRLDSAATTSLVNALAGASGPLTSEQTALASLATQLRTDSAAVSGGIAGGGAPSTSAVDSDNAKIYDTKAAAAVAVVADLKSMGLWASLSANQQNAVVRMVLGGGPGFGGPGFGPRGRFARPAPASGN
jgi:hypothetical protein